MVGGYTGNAKKGVDAKDDEEGEQRITACSDDRTERSHQNQKCTKQTNNGDGLVYHERPPRKRKTVMCCPLRFFFWRYYYSTQHRLRRRWHSWNS